jgi:dCMP deaminase
MISKWSKDPNTKNGSVLIRPDKTIASLGYNGFPREVSDCPETLNDRRLKNKLMVHAEMNCILSCKDHFPLTGYTLYVTSKPCVSCATIIIQAGIKKVIYTDSSKDRWADWSCNLTSEIFKEAGVEEVVVC